MITVLIAENEEKVKDILAQMLSKLGNTAIHIIKQAGTIKIIEKEGLADMVSLEEKILSLEDSLYNLKKGVLYKSVLEIIEKPLLERILERTEGNQLKAARILGMNRNTIRSKIKKLGISVGKYKQ